MNQYDYNADDMNNDIRQIIHVFACGDGGPALIRFRLKMEEIVKQMHDEQSGAAESLVLLFRQFTKLTATIGGKMDD